jgi:hypothetical protein
MADYEIVGELVTDSDVEKFLRTWKDKPKLCKCGAKLTGLQLKCNGCVDLNRRKQLAEYYKKRREKMVDVG